MFDIIPADFTPQTASNFIKLPADGQSIKVMFVGPCAIGHSYWTNDKKCVRSKAKFSSTPDIRVSEGKPDKVKEFMVFRCFLWEEGGQRSDGPLEITQQSIKTDIVRLFRDKDLWTPDPKWVAAESRKKIDNPEYVVDYKQAPLVLHVAFKITTAGKGLNTKYAVNTIQLRPENVPSDADIADVIAKYNLDDILYGAEKATDVKEQMLEGSNGSF